MGTGSMAVDIPAFPIEIVSLRPKKQEIVGYSYLCENISLYRYNKHDQAPFILKIVKVRLSLCMGRYVFLLLWHLL